MDGNKDLVMISRADITILDQEVLGVLGKVRGFKDTDSWGTVGLEWCWGKLWVSEPGEVGSIELYVFGCDRECVVLGVVGLSEIFVVWTWLMTWKGALS